MRHRLTGSPYATGAYVHVVQAEPQSGQAVPQSPPLRQAAEFRKQPHTSVMRERISMERTEGCEQALHEHKRDAGRRSTVFLPVREEVDSREDDHTPYEWREEKKKQKEHRSQCHL